MERDKIDGAAGALEEYHIHFKISGCLHRLTLLGPVPYLRAQFALSGGGSASSSKRP
jgi:hypothetical protein